MVWVVLDIISERHEQVVDPSVSLDCDGIARDVVITVVSPSSVGDDLRKRFFRHYRPLDNPFDLYEDSGSKDGVGCFMEKGCLESGSVRGDQAY